MNGWWIHSTHRMDERERIVNILLASCLQGILIAWNFYFCITVRCDAIRCLFPIQFHQFSSLRIEEIEDEPDQVLLNQNPIESNLIDVWIKVILSRIVMCVCVLVGRKEIITNWFIFLIRITNVFQLLISCVVVGSVMLFWFLLWVSWSV